MAFIERHCEFENKQPAPSVTSRKPDEAAETTRRNTAESA
jgi:hypothetical protein